MEPRHLTVLRGGVPIERPRQQARRHQSPIDRAARAMWCSVRADLRAERRWVPEFLDEIARGRLDPMGRLEERCRAVIECGYCHEAMKANLLPLLAAMLDELHLTTAVQPDRTGWRPAA